MLEKLKFVMSAAYDFLLPSIKILLTRSGIILMQVTLEAVQAMESMPKATGKQKQEAAFELIKSELSLRGIEMATKVINNAIEAAVIKIQE